MVSKSNVLIAVGFIMVIALMGTISGIGLSSMSTIHKQLEGIIKTNTEKVKQIAIMRRSNRQRIISLQRMLIHDDPFEIDAQAIVNMSFANNFIRARRRLYELASSKEETKLLDELKSTTIVAAPINDSVRDLAWKGQSKDARQIMIDNFQPAQNAIYAQFNKLVEIYDHSAEQASTAATLEYDTAYFRMLIILAIVAFLSLAIAFHVLSKTRLAERTLRRHRDDLEVLVKERTVELHHEMLTRESAERLIQQEKERLDVTLASIGDGVVTTDKNNKVDYLNPVAEKLTGWSMHQARGRSLDEVLPIIDVNTRISKVSLIERCSDGDLSENEESSVLIRSDKLEVDIQEAVTTIKGRDGNSVGVVVAIRDVTETRKLARRIAYQATHDSLTNLVNRREFEHRVGISLERARVDQCFHSLCYLDLDRFKIVNDTCGHAAGDILLQELAKEIKQNIRNVDTLARLGGDEFGILFEQCPLEKAIQLAETIRQAVTDFRFVFQSQTFSIGVSVGVVEISEEYTELSKVLNAADLACYKAKESGRNCVHAYHSADEDILNRKGDMRWVGRLQNALDEDRFEFHCQPIVSLKSGVEKIIHYEVLLRMRDENKELIYPDAFLPAAERYGLLPAIDRWVFSHIFDWLGKHKQLLGSSRISINVTGASLSDESFLEFVVNRLRGSGARPEQVIIELTEISAFNNLSTVIRFISTLKEIGIKFALDDFGTGFSSLSSLKQLPIDFLKIDGSFVRDILSNPEDEAMVRAISDIGHSMNKIIVAEFVENKAIMQRLCELEIDFGQGFGIAHPEPLDTVFGLAEKSSTEATELIDPQMIMVPR